MRLVYADIELINSEEIGLAKRHIIGEKEIKCMHINMFVGTGAYNLCINETIQSQLQLPFIEKRTAQLANGRIEEYNMVGPVDVRFKNRSTTCRALVLTGDSEPLLGAIPMEDMDVIIHPLRQELLVKPEQSIYGADETEIVVVIFIFLNLQDFIL